MILDLIFPTRCFGCDTLIPAHTILCEICTQQLSFTHYNFDTNNLLIDKAKLLFPIEMAFALFYFEKENLVQKLLHHLKYGDKEFLGIHFAYWIKQRIDLKGIDEIISVPLHPKKLKKRGYNQLTVFGNELSKQFKIPINHHFLQRTMHNTAQARNNKKERIQKQSSFTANPTNDIKHILIIDDVFTTGNTLSSIAWEIITKNPHYKISILVIAID